MKVLLMLLLVGLATVSCKTLQPKAAAKTSDDQKSASSDYKTISGPDDKGNNYIPFQWQVEIIKREYDDYVLPDGTVYRVPQGAVPPHRYKGSRPYDVPYYVFKEDKGHSGQIYGNRPKLVETFDTQALELLMQDWYQEELWSRGYLGNDHRYPPYTASKDYEGDYDNGGRSAYAPSEKHEKTYGKNTPQRPKDRSYSEAPNYFMRSYNGTKTWSDPDYSQASSRTSSKVSENIGRTNPSSGRSEILLGRPALGRQSSRDNIGGKDTFHYMSVPSAKHLYDTPDATSKINVEAGIRPNIHPFIQLFRGGLTNDYGP